VRADVGERTGRAAQLGVDAPVRVAGAEQPVLEVGPVQQVERAGLAAADALPRFANGRVVAIDERYACKQTGARRGVHESFRSRDVRQRLLAHDVLAGCEGSLGEWVVKVVGRADVHDVDVRIANQLLGRVERARRAELLRRRGGGVRGRGRDAGELDACQPK
jgi:hypothetical protein